MLCWFKVQTLKIAYDEHDKRQVLYVFLVLAYTNHTAFQILSLNPITEELLTTEAIVRLQGRTRVETDFLLPSRCCFVRAVELTG